MRRNCALLDPLTHISGERIGRDDPDDDHVLDLAMNAKARFIVTRDSKLLNLPPSIRARLDDNGMTVIRDDVFCGFVREQFLADEEYR